MPRDEWRRVRDQDVARRARFERATGGLRSYEALSAEVTPLDQINVLTSRSTPDVQDPSPPDPPQTERTLRPSPATVRPSGLPASVRFSIARGVSVLVHVDGKSRMSIVQALETALAKARTRPDLVPRTNAVEAVPHDAEMSSSHKPADRPPDLDEPGIAILRGKLKDFYETIVVRNRVRPSWTKRRIDIWMRRLTEVQAPSGFARLIVELEYNVIYASRDSDRLKTRRQVWRDKCLIARTFRETGDLLAEFIEVLQVGSD